MHPAKVVREHVRQLTDLPNIGPAGAQDLLLLGIREPGQLAGQDPFELYEALCIATDARQDPCVLDVLMSVVDFMDGADPAPWWAYTPRRKSRYGARLAAATPRQDATRG